MEKPYNDCLNDIESYDSIYVDAILATGYAYSQTICFSLCYQDALVAKCGCYDQSIIYWSKNTTHACLNFTQINCDTYLFGNFTSTQDILSLCGPSCPLECDSINYRLTTSFSNYPSMAYGKLLVENSQLRSKFSTDASLLTPDYLKKTILALRVYYNELSYEHVIEMEKISMVDLVSNIGGTLGLFLGLSFLSLVEIFDVLLQLTFLYCCRKNYSSKVVSVNSKGEFREKESA